MRWLAQVDRWNHHRAANERWRWRCLRGGVPAGLFLFGSAVVILLVGVLAAPLRAKVAGHDTAGCADTDVDRWFAAHRTHDFNRATYYATAAAETPTIAGLAVREPAKGQRSNQLGGRSRQRARVPAPVRRRPPSVLGDRGRAGRHRPPAPTLTNP
jgi:hypothetical protein